MERVSIVAPTVELNKTVTNVVAIIVMRGRNFLRMVLVKTVLTMLGLALMPIACWICSADRPSMRPATIGDAMQVIVA